MYLFTRLGLGVDMQVTSLGSVEFLLFRSPKEEIYSQPLIIG